MTYFTSTCVSSSGLYDVLGIHVCIELRSIWRTLHPRVYRARVNYRNCLLSL